MQRYTVLFLGQVYLYVNKTRTYTVAFPPAVDRHGFYAEIQIIFGRVIFVLISQWGPKVAQSFRLNFVHEIAWRGCCVMKTGLSRINLKRYEVPADFSGTKGALYICRRWLFSAPLVPFRLCSLFIETRRVCPRFLHINLKQRTATKLLKIFLNSLLEHKQFFYVQ